MRVLYIACPFFVFLQALFFTSGIFAETQRPNIVLYVADDWGLEATGCYGNPAVKTPGLDALAAEGTRFTQAFSTCASCSSSRSVILSGMHTHSNGMYGLNHAHHHFNSFDSVVGLPNYLRKAGYRSLCAGKYHVSPEANFHFDEYLPVKLPDAMADMCKDFIQPSDTPFFLYFCTVEPHRPFRRESSSIYDPAEVIVPDYLPDTPEVREELAQYYGSIESSDRGLVRIMEMLKEAGVWDNTVVLFVSDNGAPFPGAKTTLYDPGIHLPMVLHDPTQKNNAPKVASMVSFLDITPTLLDYADAAPAKSRIQGRSFRGILDKEKTEGWDKVYASQTFHEVTMYYPMREVRTERFKLIMNLAHELEYPFASDLWESLTWQAMLKNDDEFIYGKRSIGAYIRRPRFEFYDMQNDPHETRNLAENPEYKREFDGMLEDLKTFQLETHDPWYIKWSHE